MPTEPAKPTDSIIPDTQSAVASPSVPKKKEPPQLRDLNDPAATRKFIYEDVLDAVRNVAPLSNDKHTLRLAAADYIDPDKFGIKERKDALLGRGTLGRRIRGTWELLDTATGKVIQQRHQIVARVPHMTDSGTFINNGNEYTLNHQQRLLPGVYVRRKENGELEAHANILPGKGVSHRYTLDPEKGVFGLKLGQSTVPLMPLLQAMGATDKELRDAWGNELHAVNYAKNDSGAIRKLSDRLLRKKDLLGDEGSQRKRLVELFDKMELDPHVTGRTLGHPYTGMGKDTILATTKKLLAVSRGEADVDDRDHLAYQKFMGPEDLLSERVARDHGQHRRAAFFKISNKGGLAYMPSGVMTKQIDQAILDSGLGQAIEEINPSEILDKQSRISRMGEGGIPSLEAVPDEARSVQPSHMGFMDPLRTPESFKVGVDLNMARNVRKGRDGRLYGQFINVKTGKPEWKSPHDLTESVIAFPNSLAVDQANPVSRVPVMRDGKISYAKRTDVDYVLPHMEDTFSHLGNLIPMKNMVKGQRVAMGSRFLTQALPLVNAEAPLVQGAVPGTRNQRSFEEEYGKHMGAVHAEKPGQVVSVQGDRVQMKYFDGTTGDIDLYQHFPYNRKTYIHQEAMVKPGDVVRPGQLLAKSNYTDKNGTTALGLNARTAYMPFKGYNYEDATVISESMAKRMSSQHMYQHDMEVDDQTKVGKQSYISLFPGRFDKSVLEKLDDDGLIKVGQKVEYGEPLILAAREKDRALNKIHKKRQPGFNDNAVVWEHHDPGVVTDVVRGKAGPVVLVKSVSETQVGDKMAGRYGDKGVIAAIVPDGQMPHDKNGKPFEVLLNPLGIISRTNPAQKAELWLGKIAEQTGKPVKVEDFSSDPDMIESVHQQLRLHGLSSTENVVDPETGQSVPDVATGNRFYVKFHHTSESKGQGRGGGAYSMDESPAKGGATGCFIGSTPVSCVTVPFGALLVEIGALVRHQMGIDATTRTVEDPSPRLEPITDWFHFSVPHTDLIVLELANGEMLTVTRAHEFVLADGTRKLAGDLTPDDELMDA